MTYLRLNPPSRSYPSNSSQTSGSRSGDSTSHKHTRRSSRVRTERATREAINYSDAIGLQGLASDDSEDEVVQLGKRKRRSNGRMSQGYTKNLRGSHRIESSSDDYEENEGIRRSGRNVARKSMREVGEDYIPEKVTSTGDGVVKYTGAKESFKTLADDDEFRLVHCQMCDTCGEPDDSEIKGNLVYCQSCTLSYHHRCLGPRNAREHLVTKIGKKDFILQCRRCLGVSIQKDPLSPDRGLCFSCHEPGESTAPFRERTSTKEEQTDREDNGGEDPVTEVLADLVNNSHNVLFRCLSCFRACHMHHLPPKSGSTSSAEDLSEEDLAARRFSEYHLNWVCNDCADAPAEVESLVAWRPSRVDYYEPGLPTHEVSEEIKEYLVKWKKLSYFQVKWMSGTWVCGMTATSVRKAFAKKDDHWNLPKMTTIEAVPEDYMRVDIVLAVEYTSVVKLQREDIAKARINEIKQALVKFKGLGYEDVVWIEPSGQKDTERWEDFKAAYEDWVMGAYIQQPNQKDLKASLAKVRTEDFATNLELKTQPPSMTGGKMMVYQLEGLNWLYYQ
jgi:chromodomain-helicase-DNA-binding protein 4